MNLLEYLADWFERCHRDLESSGLAVALRRGPSDRDNRSAWLDVDSTQRLVRFTLWESGEATLSVVDVSSEEVTAQEQLEISTEFGLEQALHDAIGWARR